MDEPDNFVSLMIMVGFGLLFVFPPATLVCIAIIIVWLVLKYCIAWIHYKLTYGRSQS